MVSTSLSTLVQAMRFLYLTLLFASLFLPQTGVAAGRYYVATNIPVLLEGPTTAQTRDLGLVKAQKIALAQLAAQAVPAPAPTALAAVSDTALSRAMKDFSVQNERVLPQSYQARMTIRFDATKFEGLLRSYNLALPAVRDLDLAGLPWTEAVEPAAIVEPTTHNTATQDGAPQMKAPQPAVLILPVLNTGKKLVVWDEVNSWRDAWQKQDAPKLGTSFMIPLGDLADLTDAPDTGFINQKTAQQPGLDNMLTRYQVQTVYIALAKMQTGKPGLSVKLYRYGNQKLSYQGEFFPSSRPGFLFNDAASATASQIDKLEHGGTLPKAVAAPVAQPAAVPTPVPPASAPAASKSVTAIIPIPNLTAWIGLQQQLRQTPGLANLVTNSISANQAIVRLDSATTADNLIAALRANGFVLQPTSDGRYTLYKQNR